MDVFEAIFENVVLQCSCEEYTEQAYSGALREEDGELEAVIHVSCVTIEVDLDTTHRSLIYVLPCNCLFLISEIVAPGIIFLAFESWSRKIVKSSHFISPRQPGRHPVIASTRIRK